MTDCWDCEYVEYDPIPNVVYCKYNPSEIEDLKKLCAKFKPWEK